MEKAEKIGVGVAAAGHVLLFVALSTSILATRNAMKLDPVPIEIDMVKDVALSTTAPKINTLPPPPAKAPEKGPPEEARPAPEPEPTPPAPKPAPPPPRPAPAKPSPAKPAPAKPTPAKPAPAKPAPAPREAVRPKPAPAKPAPAKPTPAKAVPAKPAPSKPTRTAAASPSDDQRDRRRPDRPSPAAAKPAAPAGKGQAARPRALALSDDIEKGAAGERTPRQTSTAPQAAAMGPQQKAALDAEIRRQLRAHWRPPSGAEADQLVTLLDVKLDKTGRVIGTPEVIGQQGVTASNRPQAALHAERAIQAVKLASPFQNLPPEYYEQWKWLKPLRFDARLTR